jgi:sugar lactone lactonase YvrE
VYSYRRRFGWFAAIALVLPAIPATLRAQNTQLALPYTITSIVGGGTVCSGAADTVGDGCPATQATLGTQLLGIAVDGQGDLYIDDTTNNLVRRVDANTGIITVVAGSASSAVCSAALDKYGDGCTASDGLANVGGGHTYLGKPYAIAVAKNGDVYFTAGLSLVQKVSAATGVMSVVAGVTTPAGKTGAAVSGFTGDNGPATSAELNLPRGMAVDAANDVYIADFTNNAVRVVYEGGATAAAQITAAYPAVTTPVVGNIYTIAGSPTGAAGTSGNGGPAAAALLTNPSDVAVDAYGNVYILDQSKLIRMIYAGGNVMGLTSPVVNNLYVVAGGGSVKGNTLNVILGTTAAMSTVRRLALDPKGNLYISDSNELIWFLDATTGWMRPIAGVYKGSTLPTGCTQQTDTIGDGCPATVAQIHLGSEGYGITVDGNGNLYVADASALTIRKASTGLSFPAVTPSSPVTQSMELHYAAGTTPATTTPYVTNNTDYVLGTPACTTNGDTTQDCVIAVTLTPTVPGADNATVATKDSAANAGTVGLRGAGVAPALGLDPGVATAFGTGQSAPQSVAADRSGNLYIADTGNNRILRFNLANQTQTVVAGTGSAGYTGDGTAATTAKLRGPKAVAVAADGTLYIADTGNNVVRRVDPVSGLISTYAGAATTVCAGATDTVGDGCLATQATLAAPAGLALDARNVLYIADTGNNRIRVVPLLTKYVSTVVGGASAVCTSATDTIGDGCNALQATLAGPSQLRFDVSGNLYIADTGDNMVRRVNLPASGQTIVAVAGNGHLGGGGDGGSATAAQLSGPAGIALDAAGDLYIADAGNNAIRMVAGGIITTVAGFNGTSGAGTLPGVATQTLLAAPAGVEITGAGNLYVLDTGNNRAFSINRDSLSFNFGAVNITSSSAVQGLTLTSVGSAGASLGTPLVTTSGSTGEFTFGAATTNGCTAAESLAAGAQCAISAQYVPTLTGNHTATYTFTGSTGVNAPVPSVVLKGGGVLLVSTTSAAVQTTPATGNPQYGQTAVLTVTVTPASQGTSPISGSVTLQIDGISQSPVNVSVNGAGNGVAVITLPQLSVGPHLIVATYSGDAVYGGSVASTVTVTVAKAASSVTVSALPTATIQFQSVTFTANVSALTGGVPTGTVNFMNGSTVLGSGPVGTTGTATFTTTTLAVGNYQVVAQYSGDGNFTTGSSSALAFVVSPDPPDFSLSASATTIPVAQGGVAQTILTITPTNTLNATVSFSCSGLPANAICTFLPSLVAFTPATDQPVQVAVSLWTNIPPQVASERRGSGFEFLALLCPLGLLMLGRRRLSAVVRTVGICGILLVLGGAINGCGTGTTPVKVTTPGGSSIVTIQGTVVGGATHTLPVTFTVYTQ